MTIPYLPGWWDSISDNATKFASQLPSVIQPNNVAKKKFEQMVRENPMILDQLSNLDEVQRGAFAKALGYTDMAQNPIAGMPEGEVLKGRKEKASFIGSLTSDENKARLGTQYNTPSQETIDRGRTETKQKDVLFNQTVTGNDQTTRLNDLKIRGAKIETEEAEQKKLLQDYLDAKFPTDKINLGQFVDDFLSKKASPELTQRIMNDPALGGAFKQYMDMYTESLKIRAQRDIASMRTPQEKFMGLQFLQQDADNALGALTKAQDELKNLDPLSKFDPNSEKNKAAVAAVIKAKQDLSEATGRFQKATELEFKPKYGDKVFGKQGVNSPNPSTAPTVDNAAKQQEILYIRSITDPQKKAAYITRYEQKNKEKFPG